MAAAKAYANTNPDDCVAAAVKDGASAEELSALIEEIEQEQGPDAAAAAIEHASPKTPLQIAHDNWRSDLVEVLLEKGASTRCLYEGRISPLALCVLHGLVDTARKLLLSGADARARVPYSHYSGWAFTTPKIWTTLLHLCMIRPQICRTPETPLPPPRLAMLEMFVSEAGVDVDALDSDGNTPLALVFPRMTSKQDEAVDLLLRLGARPNGREEDHDDDDDDNDDDPPHYPLIQWLRYSSLEVTSTLLFFHCLRKLVAAGAKTSGVTAYCTTREDDYTPLGVAAMEGHVDVVRYLLREVAAPVNEGSGRHATALHASYQGWEDSDTWEARSAVRRLLFDAGADANARDGYNRTPIFDCIEEDGHAEEAERTVTALQELFDRGASADVVDSGGETPLRTVCSYHPRSDLNRWRFLDDSTQAELVLAHSSRATRRAVRVDERDDLLNLIIINSTADCILSELQLPSGGRQDVYWDQRMGTDPASLSIEEYYGKLGCGQRRVIAELLLAGAPVRPDNEELGRHILWQTGIPLAAQCLDELDRLLARPIVASWRGHDEMVQLAFDYRDAREADSGLAATRARLREVKRRLRGLGEEVSDHEGDEEEEEEEDDEDDDETDEGGTTSGSDQSMAGSGTEGEDEEDDEESEEGPSGSGSRRRKRAETG